MPEFLRGLLQAQQAFKEFRRLREEPDHVYMVRVTDKLALPANHFQLGTMGIFALLEDRGISVEEIAQRYNLSLCRRLVTGVTWSREMSEGDEARVCTNVRRIGGEIEVEQWIERNSTFITDLGRAQYGFVDEEGTLVPLPQEVRAKLSVKQK